MLEDRPFGLVQPILVPRTGTHAQIVRAAARASYLAYAAAPHAPQWHEWLRAPTKSVRKVKGASHIDRLLGEARAEGIPHAVDDGVLALAPTTYAAMPPLVRNAQVQGVQFPVEDDADPEPACFAVDVLQGLSTGKAAAQAAHATWLWHLAHPNIDWDAALRLTFVGANQLKRAAERTAVFAVHDAGFTEVAPGTLTAIARGLERTR